MGGVARSELVAAVTEAGGYGFLGMVREPPKRIRDEIDRVRARTPRSFGVNLIPAATEPTLLEAELSACIEARDSEKRQVQSVTLLKQCDLANHAHDFKALLRPLRAPSCNMPATNLA